MRTLNSKSIIAILSNVAELGAARMEEKIGKAPFRDAAIGTGIAVDKMLALTGQVPCVQIANIVMPTPEEQAEREAIHAKLDELTQRLKERQSGRDHAASLPPERRRIAGTRPDQDAP